MVRVDENSKTDKGEKEKQIVKEIDREQGRDGEKSVEKIFTHSY